MSEQRPQFVSRTDSLLADRLDRRVSMLAGLRYQNLAAAANLKMSADLTAFQRFQDNQARPWGLSATVAAASAEALRQAPLFAAQFDGRDHLRVPDEPIIGLTVDSGDHAYCLPFSRACSISPADLACRVDLALAELDPAREVPFQVEQRRAVSRWRTRKRWMKIFAQETIERFDYLWPAVQHKRYEQVSASQGHMQIHNLGGKKVQEFKGILLRPAVAGLWLLSKEEQVVPDGEGSYTSQTRLPLILVYSQALFPVDQACQFLGKIIEGIENPESLSEVRR